MRYNWFLEYGKVDLNLGISGMGMEDPKPTFRHLVQEIKNAHPTLSYIHVIEPYASGSFGNAGLQRYSPTEGKNDFLREIWTQEGNARWFMSAGGHTREVAIGKANKTGDLIAFGRPFIANVSVCIFYLFDEMTDSVSIARSTLPLGA